MATEYISREAAISEILSEPTDAHYPSWYAEKLKQIPAADVRPVVRGSWIVDDYGVYQLIECDQCHAQMLNQSELPNYCYECGADMRPEGRTKE